MQAIEAMEDRYVRMRQTVALQNLRRGMEAHAYAFVLKNTSNDVKKITEDLHSEYLIKILRLCSFIHTHIKNVKLSSV